MRSSLRTRLVVWYVTVVAAIVLAFGAAVCYLFWWSLVSRVDEELSTRATAIAAALRPAGGAFDLDLPAETRAYFNREGPGRPYYGIWSPAGAPVDVSDPDAPIAVPVRAGSVTRGGRREVALRGPGDAVVLVGRAVDSERRALWSLALTVSSAGTAALILSALSGWFLAGRALAPIARINRTAQVMAGGRLDARIPVSAADSELGQVAAALNTAFDRQQAAVEQQRRFTADASHELRTPLAAVVTETEWALTRPRKDDEYRESLATCQRAARRSAGIVEGLLALARADAGALAMTRGPVALDLLVDEVCSIVEPAASRRGIRMARQVPALEIDGDGEQLQRALTNLVENAVRYNREGGRVDIDAVETDTGVRLRVADTGPGIAPEHLPHIFDRFYRVDETRASSGGTGLGLALARTIVEGHGGTITCRSEPGQGAEFFVDLPR